GGAGGGGVGGLARSRSARYSSTGSTTHPSVSAAACAAACAAAPSEHTTSAAATRARFIVVSFDPSGAHITIGHRLQAIRACVIKTSGRCKRLTAVLPLFLRDKIVIEAPVNSIACSIRDREIQPAETRFVSAAAPRLAAPRCVERRCRSLQRR